MTVEKKKTKQIVKKKVQDISRRKNKHRKQRNKYKNIGRLIQEVQNPNNIFQNEKGSWGNPETTQGNFPD